MRRASACHSSKRNMPACRSSRLTPPFSARCLIIRACSSIRTTRQRLRDLNLGGTITLRQAAEGSGRPYVTDDGLYIVDMHLGPIADVPALERRLKQVVGVAEVGLFVGLASCVIIGYADGHTEELSG